MKYLYILLLFPFLAVAQEHNCRTVMPSGAEKTRLENEFRPIIQARKNARTTNAGKTCIPIKVHDIRTSAGAGGIDRAVLSRGIANLNFYFGPAGIEFYVCGISTYDSDKYYDFDADTDLGNGKTEEDSLKYYDPPVTNAFNMYLVKSVAGAAGFAYYPSNSVTSTTSFIDKDVLDSYPNGTLVHEFGHHFYLYHTHQGTSNGNTDANAENVARSGVNSNCTTFGDDLCDTHADPAGTISNCVYTGGAMDIHGQVYTPPIDNIMSYYSDACGGIFTNGQIGRIMAALTQRQGHSAYSLNCTAATVTAPGSLAAVQNGSAVDLTWIDLAANELGYVIERSETSSSTGFNAIKAGGVADNATSFTDYTISSNTTYYYRVKAINGNCNTYSNVATVSVGLVYCIGDYYYNCTNSLISNVTLTGVTSFNNSSTCSGNSYTDYSSTVSASVAAGSSYSLSITKSLTYSRYIQAFGDFNQDGDFDDAGEKLLADNLVMPSSTNQSISIPAGAYNGTTRLRVVLKEQTTIATACDDMNYGETEDYGLTITGGVSKATNATIVEHALSLIPNPSSGKTSLNVWSDETTAGFIRIRSIEGTVLLNQSNAFSYGDNSIELDVSALPSGVYVVETSAGANVRMARLFKY